MSQFGSGGWAGTNPHPWSRAVSWRGSHTPGSARSLPAGLEDRLPFTLPAALPAGVGSGLGGTGASPSPEVSPGRLRSPDTAYPALCLPKLDPNRGLAKCKESFWVAVIS